MSDPGRKGQKIETCSSRLTEFQPVGWSSEADNQGFGVSPGEESISNKLFGLIRAIRMVMRRKYEHHMFGLCRAQLASAN